MLLNDGVLNGSTFLRPDTLQSMAHNHIGDVNVGGLKPARHEFWNSFEFFPGVTKKWVLSFLINTQEAPTGRSAGSLAWGGLGNTYFWLDPNKRVAGVILTQILPFGDPHVLRLPADFEKAIYAEA